MRRWVGELADGWRGEERGKGKGKGERRRIRMNGNHAQAERYRTQLMQYRMHIAERTKFAMSKKRSGVAQ